MAFRVRVPCLQITKSLHSNTVKKPRIDASHVERGEKVMATIGSTLGPGIWTGNPSSFHMLCCRYGRRFGMISSSSPSPSPSPSPSLDTPTSGRCCYGSAMMNRHICCRKKRSLSGWMRSRSRIVKALWEMLMVGVRRGGDVMECSSGTGAVA